MRGQRRVIRTAALCLDQVFRVADQIGLAMASKPGYHGVAVRSTVLPGTLDRVAAALEEASEGPPAKTSAWLPIPSSSGGTAVADFQSPPFTIVGTDDARLRELLRELYAGSDAPFHAVRVKEAELLKYACNAFHAVKVTFANEIGAISKRLV